MYGAAQGVKERQRERAECVASLVETLRLLSAQSTPPRIPALSSTPCGLSSSVCRPWPRRSQRRPRMHQHSPSPRAHSFPLDMRTSRLSDPCGSFSMNSGVLPVAAGSPSRPERGSRSHTTPTPKIPRLCMPRPFVNRSHGQTEQLLRCTGVSNRPHACRIMSEHRVPYQCFESSSRITAALEHCHKKDSEKLFGDACLAMLQQPFHNYLGVYADLAVYRMTHSQGCGAHLYARCSIEHEIASEHRYALSPCRQREFLMIVARLCTQYRSWQAGWSWVR
ncbi:hypothetical protein BD414DRAFT_80165 [Trametes punicea]|nr:hypothetical protein BD414DRAFT_80165 [Trametes punicea]